MLVHKFGGTSVGSADRIAAVAGIIAASHAEGQTVVIVSAMSGTTDRLIAAARAAASGDAEAARVALAWIEETHYEAVDCLLVGEERLNVHRQIKELLGWVERVLDSIAVLGELTARTYDAVICHGEQLSASILAAVLRQLGVNAPAIIATDLIVTDDAFGAAKPKMELTCARIESRIAPLIERGEVPVITGYIGATEGGVPTTLGRSGSDFSAAIVAACLHADELKIWTDVDGILTADPNVVETARVLRELTYEEAARLARFGAEVLHPRTVAPVIKNGIPLRIVNSLNPDDPGTRIVKSPSNERALWPAIISATGLRLLRIRSDNAGWRLASVIDVLSCLREAGIDVLMFSQSFSEQGISLVVRETDAQDAMRLLQAEGGAASTRGRARLSESLITNSDAVGTVSVIGFTADAGSVTARRAFAALGTHGTPVLAVTQAVTDDSISFCVPGSDVANTVRFLHQQLGLELEQPER